ncbi:MAG: hypothetical protein K2H37_05130 [Lachnospiraceae bacterium]|nr:hypothetical protein [Lachnospiraceae bacterium]
MGNDMRTVKFRMMIKDIYEDLGERDLTKTLSDDSENYLNGGYNSVWLAVVYDYNKLNEHGKIIMEQVSKMTDKDEKEDGDVFSHQVKFIEKCQDVEYRLKAARAIVQELNGKNDKQGFAKEFLRDQQLHFFFWSLMILAVDDTDKEEHLSLICDFAKMLRVSDTELMDMIRIVQAIYNIEGDYKIQSKAVKVKFKTVIKKYEIATEDEMTEMATGIATEG